MFSQKISSAVTTLGHDLWGMCVRKLIKPHKMIIMMMVNSPPLMACNLAWNRHSWHGKFQMILFFFLSLPQVCALRRHLEGNWCLISKQLKEPEALSVWQVFRSLNDITASPQQGCYLLPYPSQCCVVWSHNAVQEWDFRTCVLSLPHPSMLLVTVTHGSHRAATVYLSGAQVR